MKRLKRLAIMVICASMLLACACGSTESPSATAKGVSIAQQAIDTVDSYLDGKMSGNDANNKLKSLYNEMDYVDDLPQDTEEEIRQHTADWCIQLGISTLSISILLDSYEGDNESFDEIIDERNDIAEYAGLEKR